MKNSKVMLEWDEAFKEASEHVGNWHHIEWTSAIVSGKLGSALPCQNPAVNIVVNSSDNKHEIYPPKKER